MIITCDDVQHDALHDDGDGVLQPRDDDALHDDDDVLQHDAFRDAPVRMIVHWKRTQQPT